MKTEEKTQVSAVGTFRSCVAHSIHYATETPPIPDVLLVLVAPKHINRNVTTTLQSRFTPTPTPQATHSSFIIFFYFFLFFFILFYFILFFFIFFYFILFYFILFYFFIYLFFFFFFFFFYFFFFLFFFCETSQYLALFAEVRTLPIFQHFFFKIPIF